MIVHVEPQAQPEEVRQIRERLGELKLSMREVKTQTGYYIVALGSQQYDIREIGNLKGVRDVHRTGFLSTGFKKVAC
jgi:3-deoxy-7-phosphoheptulonate synthase